MMGVDQNCLADALRGALLRRQLDIVTQLLTQHDRQTLQNDWFKLHEKTTTCCCSSNGLSARRIVRRSLRMMHDTLARYNERNANSGRLKFLVTFDLASDGADGMPLVEVQIALEMGSIGSHGNTLVRDEQSLVRWLAGELESPHNSRIMDRVHRFLALNGSLPSSPTITNLQDHVDNVRSVPTPRGMFGAEPHVLEQRMKQFVHVDLQDENHLQSFCDEYAESMQSRLKALQERFQEAINVIRSRSQRWIEKTYGQQAIKNPDILFQKLMEQIGAHDLIISNSFVDDDDESAVTPDNTQQRAMRVSWRNACSKILAFGEGDMPRVETRVQQQQVHGKDHIATQVSMSKEDQVEDMLQQIRDNLFITTYRSIDSIPRTEHPLQQGDNTHHIIRIRSANDPHSAQRSMVHGVYTHAMESLARGPEEQVRPFNLGNAVSDFVAQVQSSQELIQHDLHRIYAAMHPDMKHITRESHHEDLHVDISQYNSLFGLDVAAIVQNRVQELFDTKVIEPMKQHILGELESGLQSLNEHTAQAIADRDQFDYSSEFDAQLSDELNNFRDWIAFRDKLMHLLTMITEGEKTSRNMAEKVVMHRRIHVKHLVRLVVEVMERFSTRPSSNL